MSQTNVNIRMDSELKRQLDAFCSEIGITASAAFNIFAKTVVRQQRIPFELSLDVPNQVTIKALEETENNINLSKTFSSVDELMEDLNA